MAHAIDAIRNQQKSTGLITFDSLAAAIFVCLGVIFVLFMLPFTILAFPAKHFIDQDSDEYCEFAVKLTFIAAGNAIIMPTLIISTFL